MRPGLLTLYSVDSVTKCHLWLGYIDRHGYARTSVDGRMTLIHRLAFMKAGGVIPAGFEIDHLCRVRHCINPAHLEAVTKRENCYRGRSFAAANAAKTMCCNGHPFNETNTYFRPNGARDCRRCIANRVASYKKRKAA